jgi:hypothetical protein
MSIMFVSSGGGIVVLSFMKHTRSENNKLKKILKFQWFY